MFNQICINKRPTLFLKCIASHMWNKITRTNVGHQILNPQAPQYHCMFSLFSINNFANCVLIDINDVMNFRLANISPFSTVCFPIKWHMANKAPFENCLCFYAKVLGYIIAMATSSYKLHIHFPISNQYFFWTE